MATNSWATVMASHLLMMLPNFFVYLIGLVLVIMGWRRLGSAALLALMGLLVLMITLFGSPLIQMIAMNASNSAGGVASVSQQIAIVSAILSIAHATGAALLIAAVFAGRRRATQSGFDVDTSPPMAEYAARPQRQ